MYLSPCCAKYPRNCSRNQWFRDAACQTHPLPTRRKSWTSPCLIHLSNLSFIRLLGDENSVLAPLNRQGHRDKGPRTRLEPREVSGRSAHSQAQKFRWPRMPILPSQLLECIHQVSPPALPPGQVGLFLPPTRAIFQPLWENPRAEREECLSTSPPARGRCALKRRFPLTFLARSSVQEDPTSRPGQLLQMSRGR